LGVYASRAVDTPSNGTCGRGAEPPGAPLYESRRGTSHLLQQHTELGV
jgi:hypothetical protein